MDGRTATQAPKLAYVPTAYVPTLATANLRQAARDQPDGGVLKGSSPMKRKSPDLRYLQIYVPRVFFSSYDT